MRANEGGGHEESPEREAEQRYSGRSPKAEMGFDARANWADVGAGAGNDTYQLDHTDR